MAIPEILNNISGPGTPGRLKPRPPVAGTMTKAWPDIGRLGQSRLNIESFRFSMTHEGHYDRDTPYAKTRPGITKGRGGRPAPNRGWRAAPAGRGLWLPWKTAKFVGAAVPTTGPNHAVPGWRGTKPPSVGGLPDLQRPRRSGNERRFPCLAARFRVSALAAFSGRKKLKVFGNRKITPLSLGFRNFFSPNP